MKSGQSVCIVLISVLLFQGIVHSWGFLTQAANAKENSTEQETEPAPSLDDEEKYFDLLQLFADTLDQVERNYVEPISKRELMEAAIEGVLRKLDTYSDYIPPDEIDSFRTDVENEFGGIGIRVQMIDGWLTIVTPLVGTPAYKAGLLAGDRIEKISGESTKDMNMAEAVKKMKGPIGSTVDLVVRRKNAREMIHVAVDRANVQVETVLGYRRKPDDSWIYHPDDEKEIGYVRLTSFGRKTESELRDVLTSLKQSGVTSIILDLRFNPGGLLSSAVDVANLFLKEGVIVSTEGRNVKSRKWSARKSGTFNDIRVVVLVNQFSASASEIVAACLQDHNRAIVIGQRTWGKGSVQNIIELEGGKSALKLTTAGYKRPSGKNIHRFPGAKDEDDWGVHPTEGFEIEFSQIEIRQLVDFQGFMDVAGKIKENSSATFSDRQLKKALDFLKSEVALK